MTIDQQNPESKTNTLTLHTWARIFQVHPRTLLRYLTGKKNPSMTPATNPCIPLAEMQRVFNIRYGVLRTIEKRCNSVLRAVDAAEILDITTAAFRARRYIPLISMHKFCRWSRTELIEEHTRRYL